MTQKNSSSSCLVREYDGFEGIDRTKSAGGLADIVNFRLTSNKTLKKREAAVWLKTLVAVPRAHYVYDSEKILFFLIGSEVLMMNINDLSQKSLGMTNSTHGNAQFFCYDGKIILLDGKELYVCNENGISVLDGYAPLYGKDWHPRKKGKINQQLNLLSKHHRITYKISEDNPNLFNLDYPVESIDRAYVDSSRVNATKFTVNEGGMSINCNLEISAGSTLTLYLTATTFPANSDKLKSSSRAAIFGDGNGRGADVSSIVFYKGSNPSQVYATRRIEKSNFEEAMLGYPGALSIYVTVNDAIMVGDGRSPINAVCRRGGKLLMFTPDSTYIMNESGDTSKLLNLSSAGGCSSPDGAAPMGDSPISVSDSGILKWSPVRYDSEEYIAECISLPICGLPSPSFYSSSVVYPYRRRNEIWFTDPSSDDKRVFIYNHLLNVWYSFCGIDADSFFEIGGKLGFLSQKDIYIFDENKIEDYLQNAKAPIDAKVITGKITFGGFDFKKRLFKLALRSAPGDSFAVNVTDASGGVLNTTVTDRSGEQLGYTDKHLSSARSRYYTVALTALSNDTAEIHGLALTAAK